MSILDYTAAIHLALNSKHNAFLDSLMPILSDLAHTLPYIVCAITLLISYQMANTQHNRIILRIGFIPTLAQLLSTAIVQPLKFIINEPRPITFFSEHYPDVILPLVEGVKMHHYHSFPSGHTATFFAMAMGYVLWVEAIGQENAAGQDALFTKNQKRVYYSLIICFAVVASFSRIYLSQHFLHDVVAGAIIGILSAYFAKLILQKQ